MKTTLFKHFVTVVMLAALVIACAPAANAMPPAASRQELLDRLKAGQFVTDNAIFAVVQASEVAALPFNPAQKVTEERLADPLTLINSVIRFASGRPALIAALHQRKAQLYEVADDPKDAAEEYADAEKILTPLHVAVDRQRISCIVQEAGLLYQQGKRGQAEPLYLEALSYDWYKITTDTEALQFLRDQYIQAGLGLINCRRGSLASLKEIYFVPATYDQLNPALQSAIKKAEAQGAKKQF